MEAGESYKTYYTPDGFVEYSQSIKFNTDSEDGACVTISVEKDGLSFTGRQVCSGKQNHSRYTHKRTL